MFSFAATPPTADHQSLITNHNSLPLPPSAPNANALPPGVPMPPGAQFSPNGQGDPSSSSPTAGFPGVAGVPLRPGMVSGANSLGNPAPLSVPQPGAPTPNAFGADSTPLTPGATGTWSIVSSPNPSQSINTLYGVSCVSASDCWAVGFYANGGAPQTLIERWDGTSWAIVSSPNTSATQDNSLFGVTCASASDCWAVGYYYTSTLNLQSYLTLIERWDGTSWSIVTSPNAGLLFNILTAVTCASASNCLAVGYYVSDSTIALGGTYQTLIERWDGSSWAIVTSPNTLPVENNYLYRVTCVSASDCWAVGYYYTGPAGQNGVYQTLIERWDGISWAIVTSPNTSATVNNLLYGVTCVSASNCWAVGYYAGSTLIERWDGTSWAIVSSPNAAGPGNHHILVTCASASDCWAVGYYYGSDWQTLIERWDGTSWAIVSSPNTSTTQFNILIAVTCASASDCWAVGYSNDGTDERTLVLRYTVPPIPTSVVSRKTHGTAGDFDIDLPLAGNPGIECRSGGTNNDYQMLVTFANAVTFNSAALTSGTGTISSTTGSGTTAVTVNLTGVTNAQTITLTLSGVNDGTSTGDVGVRMSVLLGDTNANGAVNSSDISETKAQSGTVANSSNFRTDVTVNGLINSSDISTVKSKSGTALP
jgi:hypothetical protein